MSHISHGHNYLLKIAAFTRCLSIVTQWFSVSSTVKYLNAHTGVVFLRFPKKFYRLLWSALPFITCIDTNRQTIPCFLTCLHVGGRRTPSPAGVQVDLFRFISGLCLPLRNHQNLPEVPDPVQQAAAAPDAAHV